MRKKSLVTVGLALLFLVCQGAASEKSWEKYQGDVSSAQEVLEPELRVQQGGHIDLTLNEFFHEVVIEYKVNSTYNSFKIIADNSSNSAYRISLVPYNLNCAETDEVVINHDGRLVGSPDYLKNLSWEILEASNVEIIFKSTTWSPKSVASFVGTIYFPVEKYSDCEDVPGGHLKVCDSCPLNPTVTHLIDTKNGGNDVKKGILFSQSLENQLRCVHRSLICNGLPNCGRNCLSEESYSYCGEYYYDYYYVGWLDTQYMATFMLATFVFILSPLCLLVFMYFYRRNSIRRALETHARAAAQARVNNSYNPGPENDHPPTYADVSQKSEPPSFEEAIKRSEKNGNMSSGGEGRQPQITVMPSPNTIL